MTIHHINDAKLHLRDVETWRVIVDYAPPSSDITMVSQIRGDKPTYMTMDEVFNAERDKNLRELDRLFIHGRQMQSKPSMGYLIATSTPAGPVTTMPTYPQINSLLQGLLSRLK